MYYISRAIYLNNLIIKNIYLFLIFAIIPCLPNSTSLSKYLCAWLYHLSWEKFLEVSWVVQLNYVFYFWYIDLFISLIISHLLPCLSFVFLYNFLLSIYTMLVCVFKKYLFRMIYFPSYCYKKRWTNIYQYKNWKIKNVRSPHYCKE